MYLEVDNADIIAYLDKPMEAVERVLSRNDQFMALFIRLADPEEFSQAMERLGNRFNIAIYDITVE